MQRPWIHSHYWRKRCQLISPSEFSAASYDFFPVLIRILSFIVNILFLIFLSSYYLVLYIIKSYQIFIIFEICWKEFSCYDGCMTSLSDNALTQILKSLCMCVLNNSWSRELKLCTIYHGSLIFCFIRKMIIINSPLQRRKLISGS